MAAQESDFIPYSAVRQLAGGPALVLAPHPDDEVFGCGGAILRHCDAGEPVTVVILTDGERYGEGRRAEAECAARRLGYGQPLFWGYPDRGLRYGEPLVRRILDAIAGYGARIVYAPSVHEVHPDHRALAMAALEAVRRCGKGVLLAAYEVGVPQSANRLLDISDLMERKLEAVACFESQLSRHRYADFVAGLNRFRAYTLPETVTAAEAYRLVAAEAITADLALLYSSLARRHCQGPADPERPLISVVVRARLGGDRLAATLDALALQSWPRVEVVVADGNEAGGLDPGPWCGPFALRRVATGALGPALAAAQGEWLLMMEEGDRPDPDHLAGLMEALEQLPGARVAYSGAHLRGGDGERVVNRPFDRLQLGLQNELPAPAVLFHRGLLAEGPPFPEGEVTAPLGELWLRFATLTPFARRDRVSIACAEPSAPVMVDPGAGRQWLERWPPGELEALLAAAREANAAGARLAAERDLLAARVAALEGDAASLREAQSRARREAELLATELALARERLAALEASSSWRITAPLRALVTWLRR